MLLRPPQSVGVSHRYGDGLAVEVLRDAIGARDIRRHELALHTHADGMNRPPAGDRQSGKLAMMASTSCFATDASTMRPLHCGQTAEGVVGGPGR